MINKKVIGISLSIIIIFSTLIVGLVIFWSRSKVPTSDMFISVWNTRNTSTGSLHNDEISLPLILTGTYNFTVNWGDGSSNRVNSWNSANKTHTYSFPGIYKIMIKGTLMGWGFNNEGDKLKLIEIQQWGNFQLGNAKNYFYGCSNLKITATDILDLSNTTNLSGMFRNCYKIEGIPFINNWNVSRVTNMEYMFYGTNFNQSISNWDVSSVTNMNGMFARDQTFDQSINNWNVSNVRSMDSMFFDAGSFNQPLNNWNVSSVTNMNEMFQYAYSFNQLIDNWNISHVTKTLMMFYGASNFNRPLNNWNVSSVTNMDQMFAFAKNFNYSLNNWDVSNVINMWGMFEGSTNFNQPLNNWNVSNVKDMRHMFENFELIDNNSFFNQSLNNWNVSSVINMRGMFYGASKFNQPLNNWDVSNVTTMIEMFLGVTLSTKNYDNLLNGWSQLSLQYNVTFNGGNSRYSSNASIARDYIINTFHWVISDGGLV